MKARSKAQKRARKRGRTPLPSTDREPNGRKSRRQSSQDERNETEERMNIQTAIDTRIRHYGISEAAANDPRSGYALGRLYLKGFLTSHQFEAGTRYAKDMARYYALTGHAFPSARAQDLFAVRGEAGESESRVDAAKDARLKKIRLHKLLMDVGGVNTGRHVLTTVDAVCVLDVDDLRSLAKQDWLRRGLNVLARYYQIEKVA